MNKQEASRMLHPDTTAQVMAGYLLDDPKGNSWAKALNKACEMGAEALSGPQPHPITGLVPCGCGGRAIRRSYDDDFNDPLYVVQCENCSMATIVPSCTQSAADKTWNRAMGYKPEVRHDNS